MMKDLRGVCTTCTHYHGVRTLEPVAGIPDHFRFVEARQCAHPFAKGHIDPVTGSYPSCEAMRGSEKLCAWHGGWWQERPKPTDKPAAPGADEHI